MKNKIFGIVFIATIFLFGISFVAAESVCGDGICEGSEVNVDMPEGCPQDCYTDPIEDKPNNLIYWIIGIVILIVLAILFLILRKKK